MIRMSYFAKYKGPDAISVARITPEWYGPVPTYLDIAPDKSTLLKYKKTQDKKAYFNEYVAKISKLDLDKVYKDLDGKVILCYEKPGDFCHRFIFAEMMRRRGFEVREIEY